MPTIEQLRADLAEAERKAAAKAVPSRDGIVSKARQRLAERKTELDAARAAAKVAAEALEQSEYLRAVRADRDARDRLSMAGHHLRQHNLGRELRATVPQWCKDLFETIAAEVKEMNYSQSGVTPARYYALVDALRDRRKTYESPDCEAICKRLQTELGLTITAKVTGAAKRAAGAVGKAIGLADGGDHHDAHGDD